MVQAAAESATPEEVHHGEPQFNVVVKMPPNMTLEDVDRRARAAGIGEQRVEALLKALRNVPQVRIGSNVPRSRAEAARQQFGKAGLVVEMTPVLTLTAMEENVAPSEIACPACDQKISLGPQRQCPKCGVFVDKISPEEAERRKLARQERAKQQSRRPGEERAGEPLAARAAREPAKAAGREPPRDELDDEIPPPPARGSLLSGPVLAALAALIAAAGFVAGRGSLGVWPW